MILLVLLASAAGINGGSAAARAHLGSGNQFMQVERYAEAAGEFRMALQSDRALTSARDQLAICYFELRDYNQARPLFDLMAGSKASAGTAAYYLGRMDLVDNNLDSAIRLFRSIRRANPVRDELYYLGSAYYKQENYSEAVKVLTDAAAQNPRDSRVHQLLARAYQKLGQADQAEREFAETRRLHDYYLEGSVAIARCRALLVQQQVEAAWDMCRPLTATDDVDKMVAIGILFGQAEHYSQALEVWEKAVALDPDSSEIQYNLALTCFHLKDMQRARDHASAAVSLRRDFVEANILFGTILYVGREDREALAVLTHAHELKPEDPSVRRLLAEELTIGAEDRARNQDCAQAAGLLAKAEALEPDLPEIASHSAAVKARCSVH